MTLKLSNDERDFLRSIGALATSDQGEETLSGLSVEESVVFLQFQLAYWKQHTQQEILLIAELKRRHIAARWDQLKIQRGHNSKKLL